MKTKRFPIENSDRKKRKLIDIRDSTGKVLGILAVQEGISLKAYIEELLDKTAREAVFSGSLLEGVSIPGKRVPRHTVRPEKDE